MYIQSLQDTGHEASYRGLASGFTKVFKNQITNHVKAADTDSNIPMCILVELSNKQPRLQHKGSLKHNGIPEDILTKLHTYPTKTKTIGQ